MKNSMKKNEKKFFFVEFFIYICVPKKFPSIISYYKKHFL